MGRRALLLNLDCEEELEALRARRRHATPRRTATAIARAAGRLARELPAEVAAWVPGEPPPSDAREALAWCPTPGALAAVRRAGLVAVGPAPAWELLAAANDRAWAAPLLPAPFDGVALSLVELEEALRCARPGATLRLRRGLAAAGRGLRRVDAGALAEGDRGWALAALRRGALSVAPEVELGEELSLHGWLEPSGGLRLGALCHTEVDRHGQWVATRRDLTCEHAEAMQRAATAAAARLAELGYRGPFGVDAFTLGDGLLVAPTEINARYSMGWWRGFGAADDPAAWSELLVADVS